MNEHSKSMNVRSSGGRARNTPCLADSHPGVQRTQSHAAPFIPGHVILSWKDAISYRAFHSWACRFKLVSHLGIEECKETSVYDNLSSGEAKGIDLLRGSGFRVQVV
jgi:hypothetical protein